MAGVVLSIDELTEAVKEYCVKRRLLADGPYTVSWRAAGAADGHGNFECVLVPTEQLNKGGQGR